MSSIYRKGRDGYYYYQTYFHNPETGKKDKRIFHSLSTKDQSEAEEKQAEFDNQYENQVQNQETRLGISFISQNKKTIAIKTVIIPIIKYISAKRINKKRKVKIPKSKWIRNPMDLTSKKNVDIIYFFRYSIQVQKLRRYSEEFWCEK